MTSTNYFNTLIEIAEDCTATTGEIPPVKEGEESVANLTYEMLHEHPYEFTADDVLFSVFAKRKEIAEEDLRAQKDLFFSKGQPCFRASPLTKRYGWGVHNNEEGKIAICGVDSGAYHEFVVDASVTKKKAMRSSKANR